VYQPYKKVAVSDKQLIKVAKRASVIIALFSFVVSPLLQYAPEGLFQIIRIFTGFYNIPVITIVLVGLFTKRVPGFAAKVVICFHVIAYALLKFVIDVDINFIHIYAILFFIELGIMLLIGYWRPLDKPWKFTNKSQVDMTPWAYGIPVAITMVSCVVIIYLLFSPIGLVGGLSGAFWPALSAVVLINGVLCWFSVKRWSKRYAQSLTA
jgi:SSS family solute:Na+ symporter